MVIISKTLILTTANDASFELKNGNEIIITNPSHINTTVVIINVSQPDAAFEAIANAIKCGGLSTKGVCVDIRPYQEPPSEDIDTENESGCNSEQEQDFCCDAGNCESV